MNINNTDNLEVDGHFWLPEPQPVKVAGILKFDPDSGGHLSLIGTLTSEEEMFSEEVREIRIIHGESDKKEYTLEGCLVTHQSIQAFGGAGRQKLSVARIIEGAWFDDKNPIELDQLYIDFTYLREWVGINGIVASDPEQKDDGSREFTVRYRRHEGLSCPLPTGGSLRLNHHITRNLARYGDQRVEQEIDTTFDFGKVITLDQALQVASDFQDLLLIANDRAVAFECVRFGHPDLKHQLMSGEERRTDARLYTRWRARSKVSRTRAHTSHDMCFTFDQLGGMDGVGDWLRVAHKFHSQLGRVSATKSNTNAYLQDVLLGRIAALESLHRQRYPKRMGVNPKKGTTRDLWLTERLDQLANEAGKAFWLLFGDSKRKASARIENWRERAKDERNNIAHHLEQDLHDGVEELYYTSEAAYYLFAVTLLRASKAPVAALQHLMRQPRYLYAGKHLRKFF